MNNMGLNKIIRTKETFKDRISSQTSGSQDGCFIAIDNFEKYSMEKHGKVNIIPDLKQLDDESLYDVLQDWVNWNGSRSPSTVKIYFSRLKKYLHYMGLKLHDQDVKNELDFRAIISDELYGLTLDDIQKIFKQMRYKTRVQFICQMSGLMRIGETVQLRKKHLVLGNQNIIVKIPSHIAKFKKARTTFFSKEASKMLRPMLRNMDDNDLLFATNQNPRYAELNSEQILRRILSKVGLDMKYESTGRNMINTHSFRAYGITKLSRHDPNFAKKIAGQKGYLLQYDRITDEEKLELYQKYESDLIIDDTEKLKAEKQKLESEKEELEKTKNNLELQKGESSGLKWLLTELKRNPEINHIIQELAENKLDEILKKHRNH